LGLDGGRLPPHRPPFLREEFFTAEFAKSAEKQNPKRQSVSFSGPRFIAASFGLELAALCDLCVLCG
jgi:hypothetical protein